MFYDIFTRPLSRRRFLAGGVKSLAAACLGAVFSPITKALAASSPDVRFVRQIVAADNRTARTIMWQSAHEQRSAAVEWRHPGAKEIQSVAATSAPFSDDGHASFQHTACLTGLPAAERLEYHIVERRKIATDWYPLTLDNGQICQMIIMPDSQSTDGYVTWRRVAWGAAIRNPRADLWVNLGDLVDNGEDFQQWDDWFTALDGIAEHLAFVPVLGNHETYDRNWTIRWPQAFLGYFSGVPGNGGSAFPGTYFSFDYGPVHFIVLNTQWEEFDSLRPGLFAEQRAWLRRDAAASQKPWKIVLMHKDIIEADLPPQNELSDTGRRLMPLFDELPIDAVLTGHNHTYRRRAPLKNFHRDPRGILYVCTGVAGDCHYYDIPRSVYDEILAPQPETDNYLTLDATEETLIFRCFLASGILIDEFTLRRAANHPPAAS